MNNAIHDIDSRLERLLFNLDALAELGEELTSPKDFYRIVRASLYMIMGTFSASKGIIFQFDHEKKIIRAIASKGIGNINDIVIPLNEKVIQGFIRFKNHIDIDDTDNKVVLSFIDVIRADLRNIGMKILMPLVVRDNFLGFISIGRKFSGEDYSKDDFRLLSVMAHHIGVSLHSHSLLKKLMYKYDENKRLYENLSQSYYDTIHAFAAAIDAKDTYTTGHSHRVSIYCSAIAKEMTKSYEEMEGMRIGGLLHDIGKIAIDRSVINKASRLTKAELIELNSHSVIGYEILSKVKLPWIGIPQMARNHHERIDGKGYPDGLKNNQIPLESKIMSLADSFDAMTTDRPYRPALTAKQVLLEFKKNCDKQFDRDVFHSFFSILWKEAHEETKPVIMSVLPNNSVRELKNEILSGDFNWLHIGKGMRKSAS